MTTPSQPPFTVQRRQWLTTALTGMAALGGGAAGYYWWHRTGDEPKPQGTAPTANQIVAGHLPEIWEAIFETPTGEKLAMQSLRGRPVLINFWATWCPPCVEELPLLERFYNENKAKGLQIIGLAADKPEAVQLFMQKMPLSFSVGLVGMPGIALSKSWGNLAGGLPFSVMLAADGHVMQRKMGKLSESDLKLWAQSS